MQCVLEALKKHNESRELAELQADAETTITAEPEEEEEELTSKTFKSGEYGYKPTSPSSRA
ncbi:MAG: hypothetical protein GY847_07865 [Proteobacteria bacterium]|nr:hypothetical protein [Pseudomonadota bacterium]